jgi:hypothetical protein
VAVRDAGAARFTSSVVAAVWARVPLLPVIVRESAYGVAAVVVCIVSVEVPLPPLIDDGLKLPLIPVGMPPSVPTVRATVPLNPVSRVTVTVKVADCPGTTVFDVGPTAMEKSADDGLTVMRRVTGLGSELPLASITVSEAT